MTGPNERRIPRAVCTRIAWRGRRGTCIHGQNFCDRVGRRVVSAAGTNHPGTLRQNHAPPSLNLPVLHTAFCPPQGLLGRRKGPSGTSPGQWRLRGMKTSSSRQRLNARCRLDERTFAGTRANGRVAPKAVVPRVGSRRPDSTRRGHSHQTCAPLMPLTTLGSPWGAESLILRHQEDHSMAAMLVAAAWLQMRLKPLMTHPRDRPVMSKSIGGTNAHGATINPTWLIGIGRF